MRRRVPDFSVPALRGAVAVCLFPWLLTAGGALAGTALVLVDGSGTKRTTELGLEQLRALHQETLVTENEFVDGKVTFTGPLMRDVLREGGLESAETVRITAANDYYVDVPTDDFEDYPVILAMTADGQALSRRDKGPLWLMYPMSDHSELREQKYVSRLIWQVVRIESR